MKGNTVPVCAVVFSLGAASLTVQAILVRELLPIVHGTEMALGFLFSSWLLWIAVGAFFGRPLARRTRRPSRWLAMLVGLGALCPIAQIEAIRHAERWLGLPPGVVLSWGASWLLCLGALSPFCLVIGITFPLACRIAEAVANTPEASRPGASIARLYIIEAVGALWGGLAFAFVLAERLGHYAIVGGMVSVLWGTVALGLSGKARWFGVVLAALAFGASPRLGVWDARSLSAEVAARLPGQTLEALFDTPYEQVVVASLAEQRTIFGNGSPSATMADPYETRALVFALLAQAPSPQRILVFGNPETGLAEVLAEATASAPTGTSAAVTFVYPDEKLVRVLRERWPTQRSTAVPARVVFDDPRAFAREFQGVGFDLVFIDAPEPVNAQVNRLYTVEFFEAAARTLTESGVLALRLPGGGSYNGREVSSLLISIRHGLARVFPQVAAIPGDSVYLFACRTASKLLFDQDLLGARLRGIPGAAPYRTSILSAYEPRRRQRFEQLLARAERAVVNSDHHPSSYLYGAMIWEKQSSFDRPDRGAEAGKDSDASGGSWLFRGVRLASVLQRRSLVVLAIAALLIWRAIGRVSPRFVARTAPALTIFVAGFSAMTQELVLLMEYQSACGALYERLAVVSGLFMLGIAVGATVTRPFTQSRNSARVAMFLLLIGSAFSFSAARALSFIGKLSPLGSQLAYGLLFLIAGALLGAVVPAAAESLLVDAPANLRGSRSGAAAAVVSAADHAGATLAALTVGAFVLPAIGSVATLSFVALLGAVCAAACRISSCPP